MDTQTMLEYIDDAVADILELLDEPTKLTLAKQFERTNPRMAYQHLQGQDSIGNAITTLAHLCLRKIIAEAIIK